MITYFEESLKPFIKAEINQETIQTDNYKELVAKTVKIETKTSLQSSFYI